MPHINRRDFISQTLLLGTALQAGANKSIAAQQRPSGAVVKYQGDVILFSTPDTSGTPLKDRRHYIFANNQIESESHAKAYIKLIDGSRLLMRDQARLTLYDDRKIQIHQGRVLFSVAKRKPAQRAFQVGTRLARLGIRGTQFAIEPGASDDEMTVYLKEGDILAEPIGEAFKLYRSKEASEFEQFKATEQQEFESYKKSLQEEFAGYVKEHQLTPNRGISLKGEELREVPIPTSVARLFDELQDPSFEEDI